MERLASNGESFYIQKHPLKKQNSLQERKFAAGENQKKLWKIKIRLYKTSKEDGKTNIKKDLVALDAADFFLFPKYVAGMPFF